MGPARRRATDRGARVGPVRRLSPRLAPPIYTRATPGRPRSHRGPPRGGPRVHRRSRPAGPPRGYGLSWPARPVPVLPEALTAVELAAEAAYTPEFTGVEVDG